MIRVSKLADYGIVILTYLGPESGKTVYTARDLSHMAGLPLPTVSKVLKALAREGLVVSTRGVKGGYRLSRPPGDISVVDVIRAIDGPIALTDCSHTATGNCDLEMACPVRSNWQKISRAVAEALSGLTLAEMTRPHPVDDPPPKSRRLLSVEPCEAREGRML